MARCDEHGLSYDPSIHAGCVLCRRARHPQARPARRSFSWLTFLAVGVTAACVAVSWLRVRKLQDLAAPLAKEMSAHREELAPGGRVDEASRETVRVATKGPILGRWIWIPTSHPTLRGEVEFAADGSLRLRKGEQVVGGQFGVTDEHRVHITLAFPNRVSHEEFLFQASASELVLQSALGGRGRYRRVHQRRPRGSRSRSRSRAGG